MKKTDILSDQIKPLVDLCAPLKIKVSLRCVKDKYYIIFDGTSTYEDPKSWNRFWNGFDKFVFHMLTKKGFKNDCLVIKDETHIVAYIGTLFDFLKQRDKFD